jgi:hypothetical protein
MPEPAASRPDDKIIKLAHFRQNITTGIASGVPVATSSGPLRDGEACITYDYTGTAEAAILTLPGIRLVRDGRHYRSFRCCGCGPAGTLIKIWNVVEEATGVDSFGNPLWKPVHRFISDLAELEARLNEIDAQLSGCSIPRKPSRGSTVPARFR